MAVTPEDAADYLSRTNFKSVIELLTAESILHRSEDPVLFCRQLLDQKIQSRGGAAYSAEHATEYVRQCYADASANADEAGRIQSKTSVVANSSDVDGLTGRLALLEALIEACRTIATKLDPIEATAAIISQTLKVRRGGEGREERRGERRSRVGRPSLLCFASSLYSLY